jgi:hypothetical protein
MKECAQECIMKDNACGNKSCRQWIKYKNDLNCTLVAINQNGRMTLEEVGKRLSISYARVNQIEKGAIKKLQKKVLSF